MRALVLSDIHANLDALDAVLNAAPAHDTVWNLGDSVGYGACPNEVLDLVPQLGRVFVRGNHDRACAGLTSLEDFNPIAARAVEWTRGVLTPHHHAWLRSLPRGPVQAHPEVSCVHGAPADEDLYMISVEDALYGTTETLPPVTFFGHTHVQGGFATSGGEWFRLVPEFVSAAETESFQLDLRAGARHLLNPGSVGQPRDGDWRAAFALYDDDAAAVTFFRIPYDLARAQERIRAAGLPDRLASRLGLGR